MQKTVACKLNPTSEQRKALKATLRAFAEACNSALKVALETGRRRAFDIHHECYYALKEQTGLTSNYVVRAIARVAGSFGKGKKTPQAFAPTSLDLDKDLIRFIPWNESISIATIAGRKKVKLQLGNYQRHLLKGQKPKAGTLCYKKRTGEFYVNLVIDLPEPVPTPDGTLGVDLGINRVATLSTSGPISGKKLNRRREKFARTRRNLQTKGTKGAKRALKRLSGREQRFQRDINHVISKRIVSEAKEHNAAICLENLTGIRQRCNHKGKRLRRQLGRWAFFQLRTFIEYKAKQTGIAVIPIDPAYTSKTCSACGQIGSRRKHQFKCSCGYVQDADLNAALNIARAGVARVSSDTVTQPEVAVCKDQRQAVCFS